MFFEEIISGEQETVAYSNRHMDRPNFSDKMEGEKIFEKFRVRKRFTVKAVYNCHYSSGNKMPSFR